MKKKAYIFVFGLLTFTSWAYSCRANSVQNTTTATLPAIEPKLTALTNFYREYLNMDHTQFVPNELFDKGMSFFSMEFHNLILKNWELCEKQLPGSRPCGWGSDGDPFLASQATGNNLNYDNSKFTARVSETNTLEQKIIEVNFHIMPDMPNDPDYQRTLHYVFVLQDGDWAVADILEVQRDGSATSTVKYITEEITWLTPKAKTDE